MQAYIFILKERNFPSVVKNVKRNYYSVIFKYMGKKKKEFDK